MPDGAGPLPGRGACAIKAERKKSSGNGPFQLKLDLLLPVFPLVLDCEHRVRRYGHTFACYLDAESFALLDAVGQPAEFVCKPACRIPFFRVSIRLTIPRCHEYTSNGFFTGVYSMRGYGINRQKTAGIRLMPAVFRGDLFPGVVLHLLGHVPGAALHPPRHRMPVTSTASAYR